MIVSYDTIIYMEKPPFQINSKILTLVSEIQETLGELKSATLVKPSVKLRKENKIRTIHSSLAIEGNSLNEQQMTAILNNERVLGPKQQITEVQNALRLYDGINKLNPLKEKDLLKAHGLLMQDLIEKPGKYRSTAVGIFKGDKLSKFSPPAKQVSGLMANLFKFLGHDKEVHLLLKACIFHYELEFIHPFADGNGRIGRLWQQLILMQHSEIFEYISVESLIYKRQKDYYKALEASDKAGDSTPFIEFSLKMISESLFEFKNDFSPMRPTGRDRLKVAIDHFGTKSFSRKDYLNLHKGLSTATASRDLAKAVEEKIVRAEGDKATAKYKKY